MIVAWGEQVWTGLELAAAKVDGTPLDLGAAIAQLAKEALQDLGRVALLRPDHPPSIVVDHDRDVAVALTVAELIHADALEVVETTRVRAAANHSLDDAPDRLPGDPQ